MAGISPKLPLFLDGDDGFGLNKTYKESIAQNLKHLCLTSPGERVMDPQFGVGLKHFLFEMNTEQTKAEILHRISEQVQRYMPFIALEDINITDSISETGIYIDITYAILPLSTYDILKLHIETLSNTTVTGI